MGPVHEPLRMYGVVSELDPVPWAWVDEQLRDAPTYWVVPTGEGHPHPRPVWGVWADGELHLSVGSLVVSRALRADPTTTVHLDSGVDVVIVEGVAVSVADTDEPRYIEAYDAKYDWDYDLAEYGPLTTVRPTAVLAWRSAGPAGRDGFQQVARWTFEV
jgi:hypothetical protein